MHRLRGKGWVFHAAAGPLARASAAVGAALALGVPTAADARDSGIIIIQGNPDAPARITTVRGAQKSLRIRDAYEFPVRRSVSNAEISIFFSDAPTQRGTISVRSAGFLDQSEVTAMIVQRSGAGFCSRDTLRQLGDNPNDIDLSLERLLSADLMMKSHPNGLCPNSKYADLARIAFCRQRLYLRGRADFLAVEGTYNCQLSKSERDDPWNRVMRAKVG